jgi:hypothetical protein
LRFNQQHAFAVYLQQLQLHFKFKYVEQSKRLHYVAGAENVYRTEDQSILLLGQQKLKNVGDAAYGTFQTRIEQTRMYLEHSLIKLNLKFKI